MATMMKMVAKVYRQLITVPFLRELALILPWNYRWRSGETIAQNKRNRNFQLFYYFSLIFPVDFETINTKNTLTHTHKHINLIIEMKFSWFWISFQMDSQLPLIIPLYWNHRIIIIIIINWANPVLSLLSPQSRHVRFITETLKSFTISSTAIKRRPALPISPASAPQVLSPKRLCSTTKYHHPASPILSILPQIVNSIANDTTTLNIHRAQLHHSTILRTASGENHTTATIPVISASAAAAVAAAAVTSSTTTTVAAATAAAVQKHLNQSQQLSATSIMDASMGQIVPMPSMVLSQSMDSVNTATNEEEVRNAAKTKIPIQNVRILISSSRVAYSIRQLPHGIQFL